MISSGEIEFVYERNTELVYGRNTEAPSPLLLQTCSENLCDFSYVSVWYTVYFQLAKREVNMWKY